MFTAGSTVLGVTSCPAASQLGYVSPILATRWREWCTSVSLDQPVTSLFSSQGRNTSSHHYHDICKLQ